MVGRLHDRHNYDDDNNSNGYTDNDSHLQGGSNMQYKNDMRRIHKNDKGLTFMSFHLKVEVVDDLAHAATRYVQQDLPHILIEKHAISTCIMKRNHSGSPSGHDSLHVGTLAQTQLGYLQKHQDVNIHFDSTPSPLKGRFNAVFIATASDAIPPNCAP